MKYSTFIDGKIRRMWKGYKSSEFLMLLICNFDAGKLINHAIKSYPEASPYTSEMWLI